jgi:hypothetical protein
MPGLKSASASPVYLLLALMLAMFTYGSVIVGWSAAQSFVSQARTYAFATTQGVIREAKVIDHAHLEATSHGIRVQYDYNVDGVAMIGRRYRYGNHSASDDYAETYVRNHPAGTLVEVYFDRTNPSESTLVRGIEGSDLFSLLPCLMFAAPTAMGWAIGLGLLIGQFRGFNCFLSRTIWTDETTGRIHLRMPRTPPWMVACMWSFVVSILIFVSSFVLFGGHPPIWVAVAEWSIIIGVCGFVGCKQRLWIEKGVFDLIIDPRQQTVRLPRTCGRTKFLEWSLNAVESVEVCCTRKDEADAAGVHEFQFRLNSTAGETVLLHQFAETTSETADFYADAASRCLGVAVVRTGDST